MTHPQPSTTPAVAAPANTEPSLTPEPRTPVVMGLSRAAMLAKYESDKLGFLTDAVAEHGPVVEIGPGFYLLADPGAVMDVMRRTGHEVSVPINITRENVDRTFGVAEHDAWMSTRAQVSGVIRRAGAFDVHRAWLAEQTHDLLDTWIGRPAFDPRPDLEVLTSRSIVTLMLGLPEEDTNRLAAHARELVTALAINAENPIELPRRLRITPRYRRMYRAHKAVGDAVAENLFGVSDDSLAGRLLDGGLSKKATCDLVVSMVGAGTASPAASLLWGMLALAHHPEQRTAAVEEPTHFLKEVMRLWPPTWGIIRSTNAELDAGGWHLEAGAAVMVSPFVMHRRPELFTDPLTFNPARWETAQPPTGAYLPYGAGRHWCLGAPIAEMERSVVLAEMASTVTVEAAQSRLQPAQVLLPRDRKVRVHR